MRYGKNDLAQVLEGVRHLTVAKGKQMRTLDLERDSLNAEELASVLLGPTGNLRAPTLRRGKKMFVGFHPEGLEAFLG